ncbi:MAG TPA: protein kinase [Polyangiaceae bacterium]|nr:protein kinase [Polyangiaceae bacterium]
MVPLPQTEAQVFGRYALYDEIAAGGMATVHIGRLLGPVGFSRTVAIKRLHPQFAKDPDFVSMFLDEARLAARIRHPNVIGTLDVVALQGELFLVMEYVPGESLARLWRATHESGRTIPLPIVSAILIGVLDGLHAAHEATDDQGQPLGIVHRDVSPHNILVGTDGVSRVLDFGVAKAAGRLQSTHNGQLKGKISYMAPEQVQGTVDRTSDVYSASVVLWEALTGKRLFFAETQAKTLANVLYPKVERPSRHSPSISPELDALVLRGLDPNPAGRFRSAREMGRALQKLVPTATAYDVGDWVESTAGRTIATRATRVAMIARSSPSDSGPRPMQSDSSLPISQLSLNAPTANDQRAAPGSVSNPAAHLSAGTRVRSNGRIVAILALVLSLCSAGAFLAVRYMQQTPVPFGAVPEIATTVGGEPSAASPAARASKAPESIAPKPSESIAAKPPQGPASAPSPSVALAPIAVSTSQSPPAQTASPAHRFVHARPLPPKPPTSPAPIATAPPGAQDFDHVYDSRK